MFAENATNFKKFKESIVESIEYRTNILEQSKDFTEHVYFDTIKEYCDMDMVDNNDKSIDHQTHYDIVQMMNITDFWNYSEENGYVETIDLNQSRKDSLVVNLDDVNGEEEEKEEMTDE